MFILAGLVSIAFGVVVAARPGIGAVTLALLFGLYSLFYGVSLIVTGIQGRGSDQSQRSRPMHLHALPAKRPHCRGHGTQTYMVTPPKNAVKDGSSNFKDGKTPRLPGNDASTSRPAETQNHSLCQGDGRRNPLKRAG
jgi:hypothetical protein